MNNMGRGDRIKVIPFEEAKKVGNPNPWFWDAHGNDTFIIQEITDVKYYAISERDGSLCGVHFAFAIPAEETKPISETEILELIM